MANISEYFGRAKDVMTRPVPAVLTVAALAVGGSPVLSACSSSPDRGAPAPTGASGPVTPGRSSFVDGPFAQSPKPNPTRTFNLQVTPFPSGGRYREVDLSVGCSSGQAGVDLIQIPTSVNGGNDFRIVNEQGGKSVTVRARTGLLREGGKLRQTADLTAPIRGADPVVLYRNSRAGKVDAYLACNMSDQTARGAASAVDRFLMTQPGGILKTPSRPQPTTLPQVA